MGSIAIAGGVAIAIALVVVTRGSFRQLLRLRIQSIWMLVVALGIQIALEFVDVPKDRIDDLGFGLLMGSYALLLAFCFVNLRIPAIWLVALGIALNALVIGLNEGMPTRDREVTDASGRTVEKPIERSVKHRPEGDDDLVPFLGDQLVIPEPVDEVISAGDIVLAFGIVAVCYLGSRRRRAAPVSRRARAAASSRPARPAPRGEPRDQGDRVPRPRLKPPPPVAPSPTARPEAPFDPRDDPLGAELERAYARLSQQERRLRESHADSEADKDDPDDPLARERDR